MVRTINGERELDAALKTDKLVVIDFTAVWCGPCKMIAPVYEQLSEVYKEKALLLKVDVDQNRGIVQRFGVEGFPTFVFLRNGREVDRLVGASVEKLEAMMSRLSVPPRPPAPTSPFSFFPPRVMPLFPFTPQQPTQAVSFLTADDNIPAEDASALQKLALALSSSKVADVGPGVLCKALKQAMEKGKKKKRFAAADLVRQVVSVEWGVQAIHLMRGTPLDVWDKIMSWAVEEEKKEEGVEEEEEGEKERHNRIALSIEAICNVISTQHALSLSTMQMLCQGGEENSLLLRLIDFALLRTQGHVRCSVACCTLLLSLSCQSRQLQHLNMHACASVAVVRCMRHEVWRTLNTAAKTRLLGAYGTLVWTTHERAVTQEEEGWDAEHATLLQSIPIPDDEPDQALVQVLKEARQAQNLKLQ